MARSEREATIGSIQTVDVHVGAPAVLPLGALDRDERIDPVGPDELAVAERNHPGVTLGHGVKITARGAERSPARLSVVMRHQVGSVEEILAKLATASHGVVTHRQLREGGITPAEIRSRVRRGSLIPEYRGIYRVGHKAPSDESRYLAAVRAGGPAALLSGLPAAYLLGLLKGPAPRPEISVPTNRRVPGVRSRRVRELVSPSSAAGCP